MTTSTLTDPLTTGWCPICGETTLNSASKCERCGSGAVRAQTQDGVDRKRYRVEPSVTLEELERGVSVAPAAIRETAGVRIEPIAAQTIQAREELVAAVTSPSPVPELVAIVVAAEEPAPALPYSAGPTEGQPSPPEDRELALAPTITPTPITQAPATVKKTAPSAAPFRPIAPDAVTLPSSRASTLWIHQTRALVDGFLSQRRKHERAIKDERKHIAEIDAAISYVSGMLQGVRLDEKNAPAPSVVSAPAPAPVAKVTPSLKPWSTKYTECIDHHGTDIPYKSNGRCVNCESAYRRQNR